MGKVNKYSNLYKNGVLIRHVNEKGILPDYTIEELEELIDQLAEDKDKNGRVKDPQALNNCYGVLMQMYQKYGNPHEKELIEKLKNESQKKTTTEEVKQALEEVASAVDERTETNTGDIEQVESAGYNELVDTVHADGQRMDRPNTVMDEYVDFEEVA